MTKSISPSNTYVALCWKMAEVDGKFVYQGLKLKKFIVPEGAAEQCGRDNDSEFASWYFLSVLDGVAAIDGCIAFEDLQDIRTVEQFQPELPPIV